MHSRSFLGDHKLVLMSYFLLLSYEAITNKTAGIVYSICIIRAVV